MLDCVKHESPCCPTSCGIWWWSALAFHSLCFAKYCRSVNRHESCDFVPLVHYAEVLPCWSLAVVEVFLLSYLVTCMLVFCWELGFCIWDGAVIFTRPWKVLGQVHFWIALWNMELTPMPSMDVIHCFTSATCCTYVVSPPGYLRKHICFQALVTYEILCPDKYFIYLGPWVLFGCLSSVNVFLLPIMSFYLRVCMACFNQSV